MGTQRKMITFDEALSKTLSFVSEIKSEEFVSLEDVINRVISEPVCADRDIPPFNRAAVDGFAVLASDIDKKLKVIDTISAGKESSFKIMEGTCAKIMTGAPLPEGAEMVIMTEYAKEEDGFVVFDLPEKEKSQKNFSPAGEDMKKGEIAIPAGTRILPKHIATLASLGVDKIKVKSKPVIGIITTGDEIVEPWETPSSAGIRNSNSWELMAQISRAGAEHKYFGIVKDNAESIRKIIEKAVLSCDIILATGGVSMGEFDFTGKALIESGFEIIFDAVAVKPGKPTTLAVKKEKIKDKTQIFIGLPGNPTAVFTIFELLVRPCISKMMNEKTKKERDTRILAEDFNRKRAEREEWIIAETLPDGRIKPFYSHGSGHFHALSQGDVIFKVEKGIFSLKQGDTVEVKFI